MTRQGFASDNAAGAHPEVLAAMARVNDGHVTAYPTVRFESPKDMMDNQYQEVIFYVNKQVR